MTEAAAESGARPAASPAPSRAALLTGPTFKTMWALGLPTMTVILAQIGLSIAETFWVSRLGPAAIAGVTLVAPVVALMATMSNGGIGGGVASAVARALGAGRTDEANALLWHAVVIALALGAAFTILLLGFGPALYASLGGEGESLRQAVVFSSWVFAGSIPLWLMNLIAAAMRGAGEVRLPAAVALAGVAIVLPLSPALIFGVGPVIPPMGVAGAGAALLLFYLGAVAMFVVHLRSGRSVLRLTMTPLRREAFGAILGVGLIAAAGTILSNLTTLFVTGAVGRAGLAPLAGYGIASRIDFLIIPLLFGFATAVVTVVGVATGAGAKGRAREAGWKAAGAAFLAAQTIGVAAALFGPAWMRLFTTEAEVIAAGAAYLRIAGPSFGAFGVGLMLYFASQGLGRMGWSFMAGVARFALSAGGAWILADAFAGVTGPALAVALGSCAFAAINAFGFWRLTRSSALNPA